MHARVAVVVLGDRLEVRLPEKAVAEALRCVLDAGGEVVSVVPRRASLESIFLSAVEEGS